MRFLYPQCQDFLGCSGFYISPKKSTIVNIFRLFQVCHIGQYTILLPDALFQGVTFVTISADLPAYASDLEHRSLFRASENEGQVAGFLGTDKSDNDSKSFFRAHFRAFLSKTGGILGGDTFQGARYARTRAAGQLFLVRIFSNYPKSGRSLFCSAFLCIRQKPFFARKFSEYTAAVFFCVTFWLFKGDGG